MFLILSWAVVFSTDGQISGLSLTQDQSDEALSSYLGGPTASSATRAARPGNANGSKDDLDLPQRELVRESCARLPRLVTSAG